MEESKPLEPGAFPFLNGELIIEPKHIENWQANPTAVYEVNLGGGFGGIKKYTLGRGNMAFEAVETMKSFLRKIRRLGRFVLARRKRTG